MPPVEEGQVNVGTPMNVFRPVYRELTEGEKKRLDDIKNKAQELFDLFSIGIADAQRAPDGRQLSLAKTNLEQAVMWGVKGFTG